MSNHDRYALRVALTWSIFALLPTAALAGQPPMSVPGPAVPIEELPQREIFVPVADLHVILLSDIQRRAADP